MKIALEYPMRVNKLIVADIAPRKYAIVHNKIVETLLSINPDTLQSREQADKQLSNSISSSAVRKFLLKNLNRKEENQFEWQINLKAICHNLDQLGEQITSSTTYEKDVLFLKGELSDYISPDDESEINSIFPKAVIVSIPRSTHWLHAENPDAFLNQLKLFLNLKL
jgi:pimeloyl-ACP methyl ester carboxylesterase